MVIDSLMRTPRFSARNSFVVLFGFASLSACKADDPFDPIGVGETGGDGDGDMGDGDGDPVDMGMTEQDMAMGDGDGDKEPDPDMVEVPNPADYTYSAEHVFSMFDVVGDFSGQTAAADPTIVCMDCPTMIDGSATLYPIDSAFGFTAIDFVGAAPLDRDGVYEEGWIGDVSDPDDGHHQGISVATDPTIAFRTGALAGGWCAGAGGDLIKCSTEHFVTMEHTLTCYETVPYHFFDPITGLPTLPQYEACQPLDLMFDVDPSTLEPYEFDLEQIAYTSDFAVTQKDDGKLLFRWGTWDKRPTDVHVNVSIPLPDEWKQPGQVYVVTRAELTIVHTVSNSPNDQIRPEDFENEAATGRKPQYEVLDDGRWVSTVDCYDGDGSFLPAGTTLRNPPFADPNGLSSDLVAGYTSAWYTSTDREPYESDPASGSGPRWRFKAGKFGQDLPGVDIPLVDCTQPPLQKNEAKYETGEAIATTINLLDWANGQESPFALSTGWMNPSGQAMSDVYDGVTGAGLALGSDFDLSLYVKGEYKAARVYRAILYIDYVAQ